MTKREYQASTTGGRLIKSCPSPSLLFTIPSIHVLLSFLESSPTTLCQSLSSLRSFKMSAFAISDFTIPVATDQAKKPCCETGLLARPGVSRSAKISRTRMWIKAQKPQCPYPAFILGVYTKVHSKATYSTITTNWIYRTSPSIIGLPASFRDPMGSERYLHKYMSGSHLCRALEYADRSAGRSVGRRYLQTHCSTYYTVILATVEGRGGHGEGPVS